jgi:uncharacterized protein (TIGR04206 family)
MSKESSPTVSSRWELVAIVALLVVPVAVVPARSGGEPTVVSLWGLVNAGAAGSAGGIGLYPIWTYFLDQPRAFGTLPSSIRVWPLGGFFHLLAAVSAAGGVALGYEDRRVTGGLLLFAALATLWVGLGLAGRFGVGIGASMLTVVPIAPIVTLGVTARYRDALGAVFRSR